MEKDIKMQLLIHAGAASSCLLDKRYEAQAIEYAHLEPTKMSRTYIWLSGSLRLDERYQYSFDMPQNVDEPSFMANPALTSDQPYIDDTQLAWSALESQLPKPSSARPESEPRAAVAFPTDKLGGNHEESTGSDDFSSSQGVLDAPRPSSYLETPDLAGGNERTLEDSAQAESGKKCPVQGYVHLYESPTPPHIEGLDTVKARESCPYQDQTNETTSELPTSYSLSEGRSASFEERPPLGTRSGDSRSPILRPVARYLDSFEPADNRAAAVDMEQSNRVDRQPARKRLRTTSVSEARVSFQPSANDSSTDGSQTVSTSIIPPPPETALESFSTHITAALGHLAEESAVGNCFGTARILRVIDVHERGHWQIDCSPWVFDQQVKFWEMLEKVIGSGSAGWGVWCRRGPTALCNITGCNDKSLVASGDVKHTRDNEFGLVRVYCWGEVIRHVYLLLYVASNSKVRKLGAKWNDSQGIAVVQMPTF